MLKHCPDVLCLFQPLLSQGSGLGTVQPRQRGGFDLQAEGVITGVFDSILQNLIGKGEQ